MMRAASQPRGPVAFLREGWTTAVSDDQEDEAHEVLDELEDALEDMGIDIELDGD